MAFSISHEHRFTSLERAHQRVECVLLGDRAHLGAIAAQVARRPSAVEQRRRRAAKIVVARRRGEGVIDDGVGDGVGKGITST